MANLKQAVIKHVAKEQMDKKAEATQYIYSPIKNIGIYIDNEKDLFKKLTNLTGDIEMIDFWIDANKSYVKWVLHLIDNGIGGIILEPIIKDIKVIGKVSVTIKDESKEYGVDERDIENVEIPIDLNNIEIDIEMKNNTLNLKGIDLYDGKTEVIFSDEEI